jgi:vacuolar-type H+-ATPase subunit I/STV1
MLCILLLNTSIAVNETGLQIAFGSSTASEEVARTLTTFEAQQIDEIETLIRRFEARQDSSNIQLLQAVMEQTQQSTAESLDRIYAYFEEQRLQDLQDMQLGYQQLADSDYATLRSLQELAQYVSFQEAPR